MYLQSIKKTIGVIALAMVSISSFAQDAIARQAPSDKRMKEIRNVKFNNTIKTFDLENPASDIYTDWTTHLRKCAGSVPANHKIDLRGFCMPTDSRKITSKYGWRGRKPHEGIDVKVYIGDTIRAAFDGKVRIVEYNGNGYGYYVVIRHPNGLETLYGHLSKQLAKANQIVRAGDPIGLGGNTGRSSGSHLHFETRLLGKPINPALMFDFEQQDVTGNFYSVASGTVVRGEETAAARTVNAITSEDSHSTALSMGYVNARDNNTATENGNAAQPARTSKSHQQSRRSTSHSVKKGDTLSSIARKYRTSVSKLCKLNGINQNSVLHLGQKIKCS